MSARPSSGDSPVVVGQTFFINRAQGGRRNSSAAYDESSLSSASDATPGPLLRSASSAVDDPPPYFGSGYGPDDAIGPEPSIGGSSLSSLSAYDLAHVRSFEDRRRDYERAALPTIASPGKRSRDGGSGSSSSEGKGVPPSPAFPDVEVQWPAPPSQGDADCSVISASAKEDETFGEYVAARIAKRRVCLLAVLGVVLVALVAVAAAAVASTASSGKGPAARGGTGENGPLQQVAVLQDNNSEGEVDTSVGKAQGIFEFDEDGDLEYEEEISLPSGDGDPSSPSAALPAVEAAGASVLPSQALQDDADPAGDEITQVQADEISTGEPETAPPDNLFVTQSLADEEVEMIPFDDGSDGPTAAPSAAVMDPQTAWPTSSPPTTDAPTSSAPSTDAPTSSAPTAVTTTGEPTDAPTAVTATGEPTRRPSDPPSRLPTPGPTAIATEPLTTLRPTRRPTPAPVTRRPTPFPSPAPIHPTPRPTTRCEARCEQIAVQDYRERMGFPSVRDAIEHCAAAAADADGGICATKCRRECRDEAKARDVDVRAALEWERIACLGDCGL